MTAAWAWSMKERLGECPGKCIVLFFFDCKACYHVYIESMLCMLARIIYLQSKTVLLLQHNAEEIWWMIAATKGT